MAVAKDLGEIVHRPQRRAQVVRDAVGKGFQLADGLPQRSRALGDGHFQGLRVLLELLLGLGERRFGPLALGYVLNAQKNHLRPALSALKQASIQHKGAVSDLSKAVLNFEVVKEIAPQDDIFHQFAQFGNVPLPIAQLKNQAAFRFRRRDFEGVVERLVGRVDAQVGA